MGIAGLYRFPRDGSEVAVEAGEGKLDLEGSRLGPQLEGQLEAMELKVVFAEFSLLIDEP